MRIPVVEDLSSAYHPPPAAANAGPYEYGLLDWTPQPELKLTLTSQLVDVTLL